jgi:hypothetical protein
MAWSDVRPFFKTHLDLLAYTEWTEGFFDIANLPETLVDKAYHVIINDINGDKQNQADQESTLEVELSTFYKGYRYPAEAIDAAVAGSEEIMCALVSPLARTMTTGILNVVFNKANIAPIDNSNDNTVVVTHTYSVRVITAV